ncbi:MBL fold metallo-hydrolase [Dyella subtropica]|uniref:MBL fold metallo-hydrolase n=1 Tax=Dyella subtropica TaxID=2992127 RepID=UPI0022582ED1|nr:MBL fold metallo-hydrolase [Dyella subtropica]
MSTRLTFARAAITTALLLGCTVGVASFSPVQAAAPMAKTTAPGYYRMMLGDFEITALSDGTMPLPVQELLTNTTPEKTRQALDAAFQPLPYEMNFNAYLVNTGSKLVLIDTGAGHLFGSNLGKLVERIVASGYRPEQIDEIYITHMHPDHVGGLSDNGKRVFANAVVRADKRDADFWLSKANLEKAAADEKQHFEAATASLTPYVQADHFKSFSGDTELVPGVRAVSLAGHTPGHTGYIVESKGQKMLVWGDTMHVQAVQFAQPSVTIHFDVDSHAAEAMRERILADAAKNGYLIAGEHLSFPGVGHVRKSGAGYQWLPVSYAEMH